MSLSLVATVRGEIVGHVIYSNAIVKNGEHEVEVLNLGPISVLPQYQKQGVGKALINELNRDTVSVFDRQFS